MMPARRVRSLVRGGAVAAGLAAGAYGAWVAVAWLRYGRTAAAAPDGSDAMLDEVMPHYDVVERHHIRVAALATGSWARRRNPRARPSRSSRWPGRSAGASWLRPRERRS